MWCAPLAVATSSFGTKSTVFCHVCHLPVFQLVRPRPPPLPPSCLSGATVSLSQAPLLPPLPRLSFPPASRAQPSPSPCKKPARMGRLCLKSDTIVKCVEKSRPGRHAVSRLQRHGLQRPREAAASAVQALAEVEAKVGHRCQARQPSSPLASLSRPHPSSRCILPISGTLVPVLAPYSLITHGVICILPIPGTPVPIRICILPICGTPVPATVSDMEAFSRVEASHPRALRQPCEASDHALCAQHARSCQQVLLWAACNCCCGSASVNCAGLTGNP